MNKIESQFVSYQIALKLKELGFDEPCLGWYDLKYEHFTPEVRFNFAVKADFDILAPLWQQVEAWFRDKMDVIIDLQCCPMSRNNQRYFKPVLRHKFISTGPISGHNITKLDSKPYSKAKETAILKAIEIISKRK